MQRKSKAHSPETVSGSREGITIYTHTHTHLKTSKKNKKLIPIWAQHMQRQMHRIRAQKLECWFSFLGHSSFFAWVHYPAHWQSVPICERACACSWRSENNVTPKGSHLSPFSPSSLIHPSLLSACRDFPFQFRRDVRPVPPSTHKNWTLPYIHRKIYTRR